MHLHLTSAGLADQQRWAGRWCGTRDQETAIQSPRGGTKVAWGGPPVAPKDVRNRQRFDVAPAGGDQQAEADRLVSLGATRLDVDADGAVMLADPDGNEFRVTGNGPPRGRRPLRL